MCNRETMEAISTRAGRALQLAEDMLVESGRDLSAWERNRLERRIHDARIRHLITVRALADDDPTTCKQ